MSNPPRQRILLALLLAWPIAFPVVVGLLLIALNSASLRGQAWILGAMTLAILIAAAVNAGRFLDRWRAKRAKVPDGPEADYADADLPPEPR